jgi:hypothetical protein
LTAHWSTERPAGHGNTLAGEGTLDLSDPIGKFVAGMPTPEIQQLRRDSTNRTLAPNSATAGHGFGIGDMGG